MCSAVLSRISYFMKASGIYGKGECVLKEMKARSGPQSSHLDPALPAQVKEEEGRRRGCSRKVLRRKQFGEAAACRAQGSCQLLEAAASVGESRSCLVVGMEKGLWAGTPGLGDTHPPGKEKRQSSHGDPVFVRMPRSLPWLKKKVMIKQNPSCV